jgi:hypothetical protein
MRKPNIVARADSANPATRAVLSIVPYEGIRIRISSIDNAFDEGE